MEKFFLSNTTIKSFLNSFTQDQKLKVLQYLSIIGIEYIANFSNDSADLFSVLKNIANKIESKRTLIDNQPFKIDIQNIKEELTKLNEKFEKKIKSGKNKENQREKAEEKITKLRCDSMPSISTEECNDHENKFWRDSAKAEEEQRSNSFDLKTKYENVIKNGNSHQLNRKKSMEITEKITQTVAPNLIDIASNKKNKLTKHHLDDSEIKKLLHQCSKSKTTFYSESQEANETQTKKQSKEIKPPKKSNQNRALLPPKHQYSNKENLPIRRNEEKIKLATFENKENLSSSANYSQMSNEIKYPKNNDGALKHSYNPNGVRPVQHNMKKKPRKERKTSSLNYDVKFEKKVDYSHIKSKIKEEVDYHRELNKKPRKINDFLKEEIKINDNNERDSQPIGSIKYEDNWKKKYSTIPNTDSKYQAKNVGKVIKTGVNFYSKGNSNETETNGEENYDNEYQNFESTNSNPQEKLNRNYSDPYQKYQVRHYQAGDSFRPQSQDLNLSDKHFHYGDKEEIPENYENSPTDDNENEIQQNNNKPYQENSNYLKHMTEYSGYSANSNKEKITDIANNFLNSPLMGQLSQESEPKYQRDSGFMRNQGKQLKNTDGQDFASLKRNLEPKAPHYYYSLQNEQMNKASKNFNGVDSPVNYDRKNNNNNNLNIIHSSSNNNQMKNSNLFLNKKTSLERDPDTHSSSMSSNFSVFNPNEELKSFFQKEFLHNNGSQSLQEEGSYNEDEIEDNNFVKSGNSNGSGQSNSEMKNNDYLEKYDRYGSGQSNFEMKNNSSLEKFDRKSSGQSNYEIENEENLPKFNKMENQQFNKKEKQYAYDYSYLFKRKK